MLRGGPAQRRGGVLECAGKYLWALIFLVLFASRQKVQKDNHANTADVLVSVQRAK